jgi:hypothetical protein
MLSLIAAATISVSTPSCAAIEGADTVLADKNLNFLVVGELHGTAEAPAIFADLVCLAAKKRGKVIVGVEFPVSDQPAIDAFMASNDINGARKELLKSWAWAKSEDGRSSEAMFAMFERLHGYVRSGSVSRVVAIQSTKFVDSEDYERRMAQPLLEAQKQDGKLTLVLVGNAHARLVKSNWGGKPYWPMAYYLPREQTVTLDAVDNGGSSWNCIGEGSTTQGTPNIICKARSGRTPKILHKRGIVLNSEISTDGYSGMLRLGVETTASPPEKYRQE